MSVSTTIIDYEIFCMAIAAGAGAWVGWNAARNLADLAWELIVAIRVSTIYQKRG